ncbi:MAG: BON domain-containing protein [Planctomycetes bacterium]|nr:BON domain-containing protein [Planctomycetota bacterium]
MSTTLVTCLIMIWAQPSPAPAAAFPALAKEYPVSTSRDIQQTLAARKALVDSPDFSQLNLVVRCRSGVLTIMGPVSEKALIPRVVAMLEQIRGIERVQNELYVGPLGVRPPALVSLDPIEGPIQVETRRNALSQPVTEEAIRGAALTSGTSEVATGESSSKSSAFRTSAAQTRSYPEPGLVITELISKEPRFAGVKYSLNQGVVYLEGSSGPELVMEFAKRLSKIPGVVGVRIVQD